MIIILVKQILQMFLLAGIGFLLFKGGKITLEGSKTLGNILINTFFVTLLAKFSSSIETENTQAGYTGAIACIVVLMVILVLITVFSTKERVNESVGKKEEKTKKNLKKNLRI